MFPPGQYHWVSEFSPRNYQQILSYVVGKTFERHLSIQKKKHYEMCKES